MCIFLCTHTHTHTHTERERERERERETERATRSLGQTHLLMPVAWKPMVITVVTDEMIAT